MNKIKSIVRYPIKGLSGENIEKIILEKNQVLPGDREFAFSRSHVTYDRNDPVYLRKSNFLALVKEEKLAKLETKFDPKTRRLTINLDNKVIINEILLKEENIKKVEIFFQNYLNLGIDNKPKLVKGIKVEKNNNLTHSFSDIPDKAVSIINLTTISEFEKKLGKKIVPSRFRGNLMIYNGNPWEEFDWIGKKISVGDCILQVFKKVEIFFQNYLNLGIDNKPKLVQGIKIQNNNNLTHSFSDIPDKAVSIINLNTISEFEKKLAKKIAPSRFRGNLLIDNGNPWEEFNWIGKKISVGGCILEVFKKTQRCGATNVNPENAIRDINIPNEINAHYGHFDLGVYARVIKTGLVSISDQLYIN